MKTRNLFLIIFILSFVVCHLSFPPEAEADSLWKDGAASPYTTEKLLQVGDIITILVVESTSAIHKAGTDTNVKDDFGGKLDHTISRLSSLVPTATKAEGNLSNKYSGTGKTERTSSLKAKIAVVVTEVLSGGNIRIAGKHKVAVNDETQEILVSGIIRSKDVSIANTVYSYQVADADITVKGTGVVQDAESPGWFTRFLNWLF